jgi:nitroreductase
MKLDQAIEKRASIRKFSPKSVKPEQIIEAIEAANLAPSPGNLQILRYIVIDNKETKEKIAEHTQQEFIKTAPFIIAICSDPKDVIKFYDDRAETYIKHHVGAAVENFLLKITEMKLASCWVGAFSDELQNTLKISNNLTLEVLLPVGHPAVNSETKQKRKYSIYGRVFYNSFRNTYQKGREMIRRDDI